MSTQYQNPNDFARDDTNWAGRNAISGGEGTAYITIKGRNHLLFSAKKIEATMKKNKVEVRALGRRAVGHKTTSWQGTGTLAIYDVTSMFKQIFSNYANTGRDLFFSLKVSNEDPSTGYGRETKVITECNFDEMKIAQLIKEDQVLEQEMPFTFEGIELLETYNTVQVDPDVDLAEG
ncbi:MAG: phage tail tube protein [Lachnospiraceae bacterium]|nr:phage tail tube protein [Lachnospiraceae bacterium]